ncbi:MAG: ABC transporter ATP-binding protein/permease [Chloroflexota bacterium]|nr:ABC transporter ATP-binding protein/permease [Chloroflexota bacterium]
MGFIMDGLEAEAYDRTYGDRALLARIGRYFRPKLATMLFIVGMIVLTSVMDTALPVLLARGVDAVVADQTARTAWPLFGALLVAGVLSWTFNLFRQWHTAGAVADVVLRLRLDVFSAVVGRDMSFYDEYKSGSIVSRVTTDTEDFSNVVTLTLNLLSQLIVLVLLVSVLFYRNTRLALLALTIAPLIVIVALSFRKIARLTSQRSQRSLARVNSNVQEAVNGIAVAKSFRQEGAMYQEFRGVNTQSYQVTMRQGFVYNGIFPLLVMIANLGTTILVYFGGMSVLEGSVSAGDWFLFLQSITIFWFPLTSIASFWSQFQLGLSASERAFALIDAEARVVQTDNQPVPELNGRIEFRDVDFGYDPQHPVLQGFNLTIRAGETVALVGHTGAGKSSLGKLITRFYEFQGGQILIDGRDIRTLDLTQYRRHLGVVPQVPFLFTGTVLDNIRYARPEATDEEVEEVAHRIGGGEWLEALPEGLHTPVGEMGRGLAMGQRQLVALARVLLQRPSILILDEATASVDPLTEEQIQEGLDVLAADRTAIIIVHRLSTIRHADRIVVLRQGCIVEEGGHDDLMERGGEYADLYNTYFRHQSPDYRPGEGFIPVGPGKTSG